MKSRFDETKRHCVKRQMEVHEKHTIKPLVYKLWVSDCEIETGNEKKSYNVTPTTPSRSTNYLDLL